ncbi:unnamed protein product, partial [Meganyctiphanes norvegica]
MPSERMSILGSLVRSYGLGVRELLIVTPFTVFLAWATYRLLQWRKKVAVVDRIPGPSALPFVGNALEFMVPPKELFKTICNLCQYPEGIHRLWIGHVPYIILYKAQKVEVILNNSTNIDKARDYNLLHPWLGQGLLVSQGQKWHSRRKMLTPAFHFKILDNFIEVLNKQATKFVNIISKQVPGSAFNISPYITRCTLDIICETAMGINLNSQDGVKLEYLEALIKINGLIMERSVRPLWRSDLLYWLFGRGKEYNECLRVLHQFTRTTIKTKKDQRKKEGNSLNDIHKTKKRAAFLDLLLEYAETDPQLTDEEIREEVDNFTFAGHDTTASAINWTIYLLGLNPKIQEKAYAEIMSVAGFQNKNINMDDLPNLKYLECCIKEALRIYPAVPFFAREITKEINIDNYVIPIGSTVEVVTYALHRDEEHFPDPEVFKPERFSTENCKDRHPYAYVPFSAGPRNCIGQKFAMMEMKIMLATILKKIKITSQEEQKDISVLGELILRAENGIMVKIEHRATMNMGDRINGF